MDVIVMRIPIYLGMISFYALPVYSKLEPRSTIALWVNAVPRKEHRKKAYIGGWTQKSHIIAASRMRSGRSKRKSIALLMISLNEISMLEKFASIFNFYR